MADTPRVTVPIERLRVALSLIGEGYGHKAEAVLHELLSAAPALEGGAVSHRQALERIGNREMRRELGAGDYGADRSRCPSCGHAWDDGKPEHHADECAMMIARAALATREEAPERRVCDECGFKGTSDDASKEQDYCTACGGNSPAGGPDECAHCGAKNHMVMSCPKCGGRFSLDEDAREEAPAEAGEVTADSLRSVSDETMRALLSCKDVGSGRAHLASIINALHAQPPAREDAQPVASAYRVRPEMNDPEEWTLMHPERAFDYLDRPGWETQPLYTHPAPDALRVAVSDIAAERQRQVDAEGWSADRDDGYADAELAKSAAAYTLSACGFSPDAAREMWPRSWSAHWWKPTTARRDLVKAGALIVAEIERLDRQALAALQAEQKGGA